MNMSADFWGVGAYNKWLNEVWNIFFYGDFKIREDYLCNFKWLGQNIIYNNLVPWIYYSRDKI